MTPEFPSWWYHPVPLWVFVLALLTRPATWAKAARDRISGIFSGGQ